MVSEARGSSLLFREVKHTSSKAEAGDSRARHMTRAHSRAPRRFFKGHTSVSS